MSNGLQLIAMHGWCGDRRSWDPWLPIWQARGWGYSCGERGYGNQAVVEPSWPAVLQQADALVLLTSFGRFVPPGRDGRSLRSALEGMASALAGPNPSAMLQTFLQQVAAPAPPSLLQTTPAAEPLTGVGLRQLQEDLDLLSRTEALPAALPKRASILLVQAGADNIVAPEARQALEEELPGADVLTLRGAGHGLLGTPVQAMVMAWLEQLEQP